jgi:hypothetical protein
MKKAIAFVLAGLLGGAVFAQTSTDSRGVTESTDPARAAAVEKHAQALEAQTAKPQQHAKHHHAMARHHHAKRHMAKKS